MEEKIEDLKMAIEKIDEAIIYLKDYTEYRKNIDELEMEKAVFELDLEAEQVKLEEQMEEWKQEKIVQEREYWRSVI